MVKSKDEKGKAKFIITDKIKLQTLLFGADLKSIKWLLVECQREINKRERHLNKKVIEAK